MLALGLMSGTSMDGIDLALLETDGRHALSFGPTGSVPYAEADRALLRRAAADAVGLADRDARPGALAEAEARVTARHVAAVRDFVARHPAETRGLALVGFHGQTVLHRPERGLTVQIGDGAAAGRIHAEIVDALLRHPYFDAPPPKSLDRNDWSRDAVSGLATPDAAATLTDFTAASVARAFDLLPARPQVLVVCGGGAHNATLMARLGARLPCRVLGAADLGWAGDAVEAQAFAYLAVRSRLDLPLTFPGSTGVGTPTTGGVFHPAPR